MFPYRLLPEGVNYTHEDYVKFWFNFWMLVNKCYVITCGLPEDQKKRVIPYMESAISNWFSPKDIPQDNAFDFNKFKEIVKPFFRFQNEENNTSNPTRLDKTPEVSPEHSAINKDFEVNNEGDLEMGIHHNSETGNECNLEIFNNPKPTSSNNNSVLVQEKRKRRVPKYLKDYIHK